MKHHAGRERKRDRSIHAAARTQIVQAVVQASSWCQATNDDHLWPVG
jgi:hypothetical protein